MASADSPATADFALAVVSTEPLTDDDKIKQYNAQGWNRDVDAHVLCGFNMRGEEDNDLDKPATRLYIVPKKALSPADLDVINTWRQDKDYPTVELYTLGGSKRSRSERNGEAAWTIMRTKGINIDFEDLPHYNLSAASGSFTFLYSTFFG